MTQSIIVTALLRKLNYMRLASLQSGITHTNSSSSLGEEKKKNPQNSPRFISVPLTHTGNFKIHTHTNTHTEGILPRGCGLSILQPPSSPEYRTYPMAVDRRSPSGSAGQPLAASAYTLVHMQCDGVYEGGFLLWFVPSVSPPPSSPLGFSRILFWNWRRKRKSKERKKKKKRVSESEKGKQRWDHDICSPCPQTRDLTSLQRYTNLPLIIPLLPLPPFPCLETAQSQQGRLSRPGHSFFPPAVTHSASFRMSRFWNFCVTFC